MTQTSTFLSNWQFRAERIGGAALQLVDGSAAFHRFVVRIFAHGLSLGWMRKQAVRRVLIRQLYFTGVQGLPWVFLMMLMVGATAVYSVVPFARQLNDTSLIGTLINALLVQEMAPLLISIFLLARSGVAIVTEIGHMHVRGEDMLLRSMGISVVEYLFLPRLLAFAVCGLILTMLFAAGSVWLGGLMLAWTDQMEFARFLLEVRHGASLDGALLVVAKGIVYPLLGCAMLLFQGGRTRRNPNLIPVCTTRGVLWALMLMVLTDVGITVGRSVL